MTCRSATLALALSFAVCAPALATGVSGHLDDLPGAITARRDALADDPDAKAAVARLAKALKVLAKPTLEKDYAGELKGASKLAKILTGPLAAEVELIAMIQTARDGYRADLTDARARLAALLATPAKADKVQKTRTKQLKKGDKGIAKADAASSLTKELKSLAKAAKSLQEYIESAAGPGGGLAIAAYTADYDRDGNARLYLASSDGEAITVSQYLDDPHHVTQLGVSSAGGEIAFAVERNDAPGLYLLGPGGQPFRASPDDEEGIREIVFSPDGSLVAYRVGDPARLAVVNADGTGHTVVSEQVTTRVLWSPDGSRVAYRSDRETAGHFMIYTALADGTGEVKISTTAAPAGDLRVPTFAWSPTENRLNFRLDGEVAGEYEVYVASGDGTLNVKASTETGTVAGLSFGRMKWSPDGSTLLYVKRDAVTGLDGLFEVGKDGTGAKKVSPDSAEAVGLFFWDPVGGRFAYELGEGSLRIGTSAGDSVEVVSAGYVGTYEWNREGEFLLVTQADDAQSPKSLWAVPAPPRGPVKGQIKTSFEVSFSGGDLLAARLSGDTAVVTDADGNVIRIAIQPGARPETLLASGFNGSASLSVDANRVVASVATDTIHGTISSHWVGTPGSPGTVYHGVGSSPALAGPPLWTGTLSKGYQSGRISNPFGMQLDFRWTSGTKPPGPENFTQDQEGQVIGTEIIILSLANLGQITAGLAVDVRYDGDRLSSFEADTRENSFGTVGLYSFRVEANGTGTGTYSYTDGNGNEIGYAIDAVLTY